jgi:hypothetical protein
MSASYPFLLPGLIGLASQKRFCLWLHEPVETGSRTRRKLPYGEADLRAAANNEQTWLAYASALDLWERCRYPSGNAGGLGIFLGHGLIGFDLDACVDSSGIAPWALELLPLLGGCVEISPGGRGLKVLMWVTNEAVLSEVLAVLGIEPGRKGGVLWKKPARQDNGAGDGRGGHGPGIEFYAGYRFFAITGNGIYGDMASPIPVLDVPGARAIKEIVDRIAAREGVARPRIPLRIVDGGVPDGYSATSKTPADLPYLGRQESLSRVRSALRAHTTTQLGKLLEGADSGSKADSSDRPDSGDGSRSALIYRLAKESISLGMSENDFVEFVAGESEQGGLIRCERIKSWISEKGVRADYRELRRAYRHTPPGLRVDASMAAPIADNAARGASGNGSSSNSSSNSSSSSSGCSDSRDRDGRDGSNDIAVTEGDANGRIKPGAILHKCIQDYMLPEAARSTLPDHPLIAWGGSNSGIGRPVLTVTDNLADVVDAFQLLLVWSGLPVFTQGGKLVSPVTMTVTAGRGRMTEALHLTPLTLADMMYIMYAIADWQGYDRRSRQMTTCRPPEDVGKMILAIRQYWRARPIVGLATCPTLRSDGSVITRRGYDPATLRYAAWDESLEQGCAGPVADWGLEGKPSRTDALAALDVLDGLFNEVAFETERDRSIALSYLLTAIVRPAMDVAPMHCFRAAMPGSGKTYISHIVAAVMTGRLCPVIAASDRFEEQEKQLKGMLQAGVPIVSIDNLNGDLRGDLLGQAIEQPFLRIRPLGEALPVELQNVFVFSGNGNNMRVIGDMARRLLMCNLRVEMERPETRVFRHDPVADVLADRGSYLRAALIVIRAHAVAGYPGVSLLNEQFQSFGEYSRFVRGALVWLGRVDPCLDIGLNKNDDPDLQNLATLLRVWRDVIGLDTPLPLKRVVEMAMTGIGLAPETAGFASAPTQPPGAVTTTSSADSGQERTPETRPAASLADLREALFNIAGERGAINKQRLGFWLLKKEKRIVDGLCFEKSKNHIQHSMNWSVCLRNKR